MVDGKILKKAFCLGKKLSYINKEKKKLRTLQTEFYHLNDSQTDLEERNKTDEMDDDLRKLNYLVEKTYQEDTFLEEADELIKSLENQLLNRKIAFQSILKSVNCCEHNLAEKKPSL